MYYFLILLFLFSCSSQKKDNNNLIQTKLSIDESTIQLKKDEIEKINFLCSNQNVIYPNDSKFVIRHMTCGGEIKTKESFDQDILDITPLCHRNFNFDPTNKIINDDGSIDYIFFIENTMEINSSLNGKIFKTFKVNFHENQLTSIFQTTICPDKQHFSQTVYTKKKDSKYVMGLTEGVVGATCWANPVHFVNGRDVCFSVDERFYPGILMVVAKKSMINLCKEKNALDASGGHCYNLCETQSYCIYGDNR